MCVELYEMFLLIKNNQRKLTESTKAHSGVQLIDSDTDLFGDNRFFSILHSPDLLDRGNACDSMQETLSSMWLLAFKIPALNLTLQDVSV